MTSDEGKLLAVRGRFTKNALGIAALIALLTFSAPALTEDWCVGKDAVPFDDGHYHFSYESWVRARANAFMYGRCIKVLDPTAKLRNRWEGVLPLSIATKDRPTVGGQDFVDDATESGSAKLHYGNSDDSLDAAYFRHKGEPSENRETTYRDKISAAVKSAGSFVLESIYSFSIPLVSGDDNSVANVDLLFRSSFDGKNFAYSLSYTKQAMMPQYAETRLSVEFKGEEISRLEKAANTQWLLSKGKDDLHFQAPATNGDKADFVDHEMTLLDQNGQPVATLPISYLLPAEN
ncbi:MAG: hypothetical protein EOS79_12165 [Mesorhizobium sp.]|nr:MAG: hypothetical protein EOS79_12165 [Mesorhizobium sp.]